MYILIVGFKQAFDRLKQTKIIEDLESITTPSKLIKLIKMMLNDSEAAVNTI